MACILLIALVLLQQGKGADAGASFGGDSSSAFGPMVENPLKNITTIVAVVFMSTSVSLAYNSRYAATTQGELFSRPQEGVTGSVESTNTSANPAVPSESQDPSVPSAETIGK